jgi:copper resistance protein C
MRGRFVLSLLPIGLFAASAAFGAAAPPQVVSDPEPNSVVEAPVYMIHVTFPDPVDVKTLRMAVTGKDGKQVEVGEAMAMGNDSKMLMTMPKTPLPAGGYTVKWRAAAAGGKELQGEFSFTAK